MKLERLEEIEARAAGSRSLQTHWLITIKELIADNKRLRGFLNKIEGKAKEAQDG